MSEYLIRVRTPSGVITEVWCRGISYTYAAAQAQAYGEVLGLIESRYV